MKGYKFEDTKGTFHLKKAENISYLYFPIAGEAGLKSSLTPNLGGDAKIDQNTFLLEPVSAENLVNNRNSRNFCHINPAVTSLSSCISVNFLLNASAALPVKDQLPIPFTLHQKFLLFQ